RLVVGLDPGIKHFRRIATRFEKTAGNFLAAIKLASVRVWLHRNEATAQKAPGMCFSNIISTRFRTH
ncbi:MAG: transposase, partial [Methylobacterium sp.]|nr:transposase [Methylobacterium sp.]